VLQGTPDNLVGISLLICELSVTIEYNSGISWPLKLKIPFHQECSKKHCAIPNTIYSEEFQASP
jgi:hypothetical protein